VLESRLQPERNIAMSDMTNDQVQVLVLRDGEGGLYVLTEEMIRSSRATPEQQQAVQQAVGDVDVSGFAVGAGGFSPVGAINIVVAPQINNQIALNIAAGNFAPVTQVGSNVGGNILGATQRG
jgi:hypothetical protein